MPSVSARRLIKFLPCRGLSAALRQPIPEQSRADKPTRRFAALRCPLPGLRDTGCIGWARLSARAFAVKIAPSEASMNKLLPTTLVGSYAQPDWLIDRARLAGRFPPRVRARELWRVAPEYLEAAQDDATLLAIRAQEQAGLDIITDGEMRRESYSNRFATALEGVDIDNPGTALDRSGHPNPVPRVAGKVRRRHAVEVRDVQFLRLNTDRMIKMTVPGPFTMSQQAQNDFYGDEEELALDYAAAVNAEIKDLFAAGADIVQIDEPYMQARPEKARRYGIKALNRALDGVTGTTAVHICFGYAAIIHQRPSGYSFLPELEGTAVRQVSIETAQSGLDCAVLERLASKTIILGVLDLSDMTIESPRTVADRIRRALPHAGAERIVVAPDCGLKYLPRDVAYGKMCAMVEGARMVRRELGG
jgi:5-methyltetrahydropteroyltriglutamate--homocysteine methyltransferase